jgi:hypothetical protein
MCSGSSPPRARQGAVGVLADLDDVIGHEAVAALDQSSAHSLLPIPESPSRRDPHPDTRRRGRRARSPRGELVLEDARDRLDDDRGRLRGHRSGNSTAAALPGEVLGDRWPLVNHERRDRQLRQIEVIRLPASVSGIVSR